MRYYHPWEISNEILKDKLERETLHTISYKTMKRLIKKVLNNGFKVTQVYVGNCKVFDQSFQRNFYKDFPELNF